MAVGNRTSFDYIKFYNFYHNKTILILSQIFAASRIYLGFIAADTGNTGAGTELPPVIPGATVVGTAAVGAGERTLRRSSMRS